MKEGRRTWREPSLVAPRPYRSGIPAREVLVDSQSSCGALFWVKLGRKNVIPRHHAGKGPTVDGFPEHDLRVGGGDVVAVHEIEPALVGNAVPQQMRPRLAEPVPSHMRHFEAPAVRLIELSGAKTHHGARKEPQPWCSGRRQPGFLG